MNAEILNPELLKRIWAGFFWLEYRRVHTFVRRLLRISFGFVFPFFFTAIGLALSSTIFTNLISISSLPGNISTMLLTSATILGGFFALASTLSVIPLQNSMGTLTPSMRHHLAKDFKSVVSFTGIGFLTVALFFLAGCDENFASDKTKLSIGLMLTAISFDLIRLYQASIIRLMEPIVGIDILRKKFLRFLDQCLIEINGVVSVQVHNDFGEATAIIQQNYSQLGINASLKLTIAQMSEVARRAVKIGDLTTCSRAVTAEIDVFEHFLRVRKNTLSLQNSPGEPLIVRQLDIHNQVVSILEELRLLNQQAIDSHEEAASHVAIQAYERLGASMVQIEILRGGVTEFVPETALVIGYMETSGFTALKAGFGDIGLACGRAIENIAKLAKPNLPQENFYGAAIQKLDKLVRALLLLKQDQLANELTKNLYFIAAKVTLENHYQKRYLFQTILNKYETYLPLAQEQAQPLGASLDIYSSISDRSIFQLTVAFFNLYLQGLSDEQREGRPYFTLADLSYLLTDLLEHLEKIGSRNDLSAGMTLWNLIQFINTTSEHLFDLLSRDNVPDDDKQTLKLKLVELCRTNGSLIPATKPFNIQNAIDAADTSARIGLLSLEQASPEIALESARSIERIFRKTVAAYAEPFNRSDVLISMVILRIYAAHVRSNEVVAHCDSVLDFPLPNGTPEENVAVLEALENRRGHLDRDLRERGYPRLSDSARDILRRVLIEEGSQDTDRPPRSDP